MIIKNIKLNNFGIYKGVNNYSFDVDDEKNVVVINGNNGSGKTTLLEAIKISLYGPYYLGYQTDNDKYYEFIENKLNAYALESPDSEFELEINISLWEKGGHNDYCIIRQWNYNNNRLKENNTVIKNDLILSTTERNNFFIHLQTHLPLNLFNVFFFDGEQLDKLFMLDNNPDNLDEFNNLFNTLFNIDLFTQLKKDVRNYLKQKNVYSNLSIHEKEYTDMLAEQEKVETLILKNQESIDTLKIEKDHHLLRIESLEKDFQNIGGLSNDLTIKLNNQIKTLEEEKKILEFENKRILNEYLPFMILNDELNKLIDHLDRERVNHEHRIIKDSLADSNLVEFIKSNTEIDINNIESIMSKISDYFELVDSPDLEYNLSIKDYYFVKSLKEDILGIENDQLRINNTGIDDLNRQIYKLQQKLDDSHGEEVNIILQNIKDVQNSIAHFDESIASKEYTLEEHRNELDIIENNLADLKKIILYTKKDENIFTIIDRIEQVIDVYVLESKKQKLDKLEYYTTQMFNNLIRKDDFIKGIKIEKDSGNIKIINSLGKEMPASNLSAGERQIYALSLIWGLLKISDKRIPLVFDTLLGRLDKSHKKNILQHFLHTIGEQVIVLATDSELSDESLTYLDPYIKTSYAIDFNSTDRDVTIQNRSKVV